MANQNSEARERIKTIVKSMYQELGDGMATYTPKWDEDKQWLCTEIKQALDRAETADADVLRLTEKYESGNSAWNIQQAKIESLEAEVKRLKKELSDSIGHSNCYCKECRERSVKFWHPKQALDGAQKGERPNNP